MWIRFINWFRKKFMRKGGLNSVLDVNETIVIVKGK